MWCNGWIKALQRLSSATHRASVRLTSLRPLTVPSLGIWALKSVSGKRIPGKKSDSDQLQTLLKKSSLESHP